MDIPVVDVEADGSADLVESLDTGGSRVDGEHIVFLVEDDLEYVRMSADEDVRQVGVDKLEGLVVVPAGIASYVHHQHFLVLTFEKLRVRDPGAYRSPVAVAVDAFQRFERRYLQQGLLIAEVPRVPYLVHRFKKLPERVIEPAVCI